MNEFQVQAAVATAQSSRMPVLLMVPLRVMRDEASMRLPPVWLRAKSLKVFWPSAGFEVLIRGIEITPFLLRTRGFPGAAWRIVAFAASSH